MSSRTFLFFSNTDCRQRGMEAPGRNGNQIPQSQHGPDKRAVGHWAAAGPCHSRCRTFIFWGSCGGPKGEGPSQAPKAVEGGGGRGT